MICSKWAVEADPKLRVSAQSAVGGGRETQVPIRVSFRYTTCVRSIARSLARTLSSMYIRQSASNDSVVLALAGVRPTWSRNSAL